MTEDRDPTLQALFANTEQDLAGAAFTAQVMAQTDRLRHRAIFGWICAGLVFAAFAWLLAAPLQAAVSLLTHSLAQSLINLDDGWLAQLLSPINSPMILIALGLIGLRFTYRKIFS